VSSSVLTVGMADDALERTLRERLATIETGLADAVRSEHPFITEAAQHVMKAGGKRFRPMLVLLAAEFGEPDRHGVVESALVVELTHLATLYHDDVMDEAEIRRGSPSANARWSNSVAIMTGDYLFARASEIVSDLGPWAVQVQAQTFSRLVQGQIRETIGPQPGDDAMAHYLRTVADKTASLVATSARFGATFAGVPPDQTEVLAEFAEQLGITFQLADDVLDVVTDDAGFGKEPGTDLREGIATLPVLLATASPEPGDDRLAELLGGDLTHAGRHAEALALLRAHPATAAARAEVWRRAAAARGLLDELPACAARDALADLCDAVAKRNV
jgi:geranylgeranyl pyrophosphate synthase